jgi:hypothetical protein
MPQFKTALKKSDFQEGKLMKSEIGGKSIVIGMVEDFSLPKAPHQFEIGSSYWISSLSPVYYRTIVATNIFETSMFELKVLMGRSCP